MSTSTEWSTKFETLRRQKLFQRPPSDRSSYPALIAAVRPHLESFNALFEGQKLLEQGLKDIGIHSVLDGPVGDQDRSTKRNQLDLRIHDVVLEKATLPPTNKFVVNNREIYPSEARERHTSYKGKLRAKLQWRVNGGDWKEAWRELGPAPLLVRSNRCHLQHASPKQLVQHKEDSEEQGGYFIINGNERLLRMLIMPRRNYPMAITRNGYAARGPTYTKYGVSIRSVRPDQTSQTIVLHYLNDGNVTFRFSWRKNEYLVPVMMVMNALVETNDREIFEGILGPTSTQSSNAFVTDRLEVLLRTYKAYGLQGRKKTREYLGDKFRIALGIPITIPDEVVGEVFLRKVVLPHLGNLDVTEQQQHDKFRQLIFMTRKLYALSAGDCAIDNPDAISNQEALLSGFLYGMVLKDRIQEWLHIVGYIAVQWANNFRGVRRFVDSSFGREFLPTVLARSSESGVCSGMQNFIATGNLVSSSGLDLSSTAGYSIMAERLNFYRFISHFRSIHRGNYFATIKTTSIRKLLPESWGFLCPVHTPDGSPCGLMNHLAHRCEIQVKKLDTSAVESALFKLGISDHSSFDVSESVVVQLDGKVLGYCPPAQAQIIARTLRHWKVRGENGIPVELEIGHVPNSNKGLYPGLFMFSQAARMLRKVKYLPLNGIDYVGPFEQPFMDIACVAQDVRPGVTTHMEFEPTDMLSILANMTPFSDFNQSPRNMYQCQMSKQTMGTPTTNLKYRTDNKAYLLQTGQTPIARPPLYNQYGLDNYPNGMNAVVAVISYTGYDMDDAMIVNKSSHERGFGDGIVYKTKVYDLEQLHGRSRKRKDISNFFGFAPQGEREPTWADTLDDDGLPFIGARIREGDKIIAYHKVMLDPSTGRHQNLDQSTSFFKYKDPEECYIDQIRLIGSEVGDQPCQAISVKFRVPRRPAIGDKFSSRHGQKGVCSQFWPSVNMPFSESGIQPDVIINPHAFPSRMTIGMFVESLAGKSGAVHGLAQDSTPFQFSEDDTAGDFFGHQLKEAGFNFFGNEPMYSGVTGQEFAADIYLGVVYYQRLRHMVNDKFQVRTTGPVNAMTGQPVKGRSKGGGIRVGEMERDALLAHGAAFLLQDRLMNCSDATKAWICRTCGSFLSTQLSLSPYTLRGKGPGKFLPQSSGVVRCRACARPAVIGDSKMDLWEDGSGQRFVGGEQTTMVSVPGVLKYLDVELSAMGIKMKFSVRP